MPVARRSRSSSTTPAQSFTRGISRITMPQLTYVLLLVAVFLIGYLLARVQSIEGGGILAQNNAGTAAQGGTAAPAGQTGAPRVVEVENGTLPVKGDEDAPVTIVEFSDFECPFCGRFYTDTLPQLQTEYIDTGKVKLYYRHYPLSFHPKAVPLALASECANDQDKFWEMHDKIFENNATIANASDDVIKGYAAELGLDTASFNSCYDSKEHQAKVDEDMNAGSTAGVSGTPTFYINGNELVGAQPFSAFKTIIDQELAK